jgi:hypothetical protein
MVKISEPDKFPSDAPVNIEEKALRKAYLISFDPQLLADRILLLEGRVWEAQRTLSVYMDYNKKENKK